MNDNEVRELMLQAYRISREKIIILFALLGIMFLVGMFTFGIILGCIGVNIYESMQPAQEVALSVEK